ncbi:hypothetical protein M8494_26340 [Serratia ureilytica]
MRPGCAACSTCLHMTIVDLHGARTREFLRYLLANDVAKLTQTRQSAVHGML